MKIADADVGAQSGAQSRAQSNAILQALVSAPLSASEIAFLLQVETKTGALKRTLKNLLMEGLIIYTLPEKPTSRLQKYRLTTKGEKALAEEESK